MASVTNVDGSNPGPNVVSQPDTVQAPVGNVWKLGAFELTLAPTTVGIATIAEQTFTMTGLLTTDIVYTSMQSPAATCGILNSRCSATGVLAIEFICYSNTTSGGTAALAGVYNVQVVRVQPNWSAPSTGSLLDW